jgi:hypothetical protein
MVRNIARGAAPQAYGNEVTGRRIFGDLFWMMPISGKCHFLQTSHLHFSSPAFVP